MNNLNGLSFVPNSVIVDFKTNLIRKYFCKVSLFPQSIFESEENYNLCVNAMYETKDFLDTNKELLTPQQDKNIKLWFDRTKNLVLEWELKSSKKLTTDELEKHLITEIDKNKTTNNNLNR